MLCNRDNVGGTVPAEPVLLSRYMPAQSSSSCRCVVAGSLTPCAVKMGGDPMCCPCRLFCRHGSPFASLWQPLLRWVDSEDGHQYSVQVAFQLRIRPGTYGVGQHTFGSGWTKTFDDTGTYTNNEVGSIKAFGWI